MTVSARTECITVDFLLPQRNSNVHGHGFEAKLVATLVPDS